MNKIYIAIFFVAGFCGAYFAGFEISDARCRMNIAEHNMHQMQNIQVQSRNIKKENHDKVYKTGTDVIRLILRDKYTIMQ